MTANPNKILDRLTERFAPADAISRQQLREYLGISISTDCRLKKSGHYPNTVNVAGSEKLLLIDLAAWLDASGSPAQERN